MLKEIFQGRRASAKTSIWSTKAAIVIANDSEPKFHCAVFGFEGHLKDKLSSSNIMSHYQFIHKNVLYELLRLDTGNETDEQLRKLLSNAHNGYEKKKNASSIKLFFSKNLGSSSTNPKSKNETVATSSDVKNVSLSTVPEKLNQITATILCACATETPLYLIGVPEPQGFIDVVGGRAQCSNKLLID